MSYTGYDCIIELITNWQEQSEEIELFKYLHLANFDAQSIYLKVREQLDYSRGRARAVPTPLL